MQLIGPVFILILVWIVMSQWRKRQFEREYLELRRREIEKGVTGSVSDSFYYQRFNGGSAMRVGIVALVLGATLLLLFSARGLFFLGFPHHIWGFGAGKFFIMVGIIAIAIGLANMLIWIFVDKPRRDRIMRM
jgi:hypothetical protein